jgi:hypothetical protein
MTDYRHYARRATLGMVGNAWVDRHPYISFLIFLALMFALMALCGLSDGPDRIAALGGH